MKEQKTPLIRLAKRDGMSAGQVWGIRIGSFVVAILIGALIFLVMGSNPLAAYGTIVSGSLGKSTAIRQTVRIAIPLLGTALAIAPCFKMRFWNIGAEGQITAGAVAASYFALFWHDKLPSAALILVMAVAGAVAGGIWALIPAFFKAKWGTNETLFTLMMNYVATQLVSFAITFWENPVGSNTVGIINSATSGGWLPSLFGQRYLLNIVVVVLLTLGMFVYLQYSKQGYEIAVVGESQNTARYIGIDVGRVIVRTMAISGAVCGLAGLMLVAGTDHTISTNTVGGQGFTAIMVSWLAKFNPVFMALTSFLLIFLERGSGEIATTFRLNESVSDILTGIILFFIIGCEFFVNYKVYIRLPRKEGSGNA